MQTLEQYKQYECVGILKENAKKQVRLYRNTELDKMIVERIIKSDSADVYKTLSGISHPCLLEIYEAVLNEDKLYILEEYFDGVTLSEILNDRLLSRKEVKQIAIAVCNALEALHANGIIHRDINPQNIMIDASGNVKLIDYDISKRYKAESVKDTTMLGTLGFAAPEQYGIAQSNERTDIFATGVLINQMLTGEHPSVKLCGGSFRRVVQKCTVTENAGRYKNVLDLKKALLLC